MPGEVKPRRYESALRREQAAATRTRIVQAAARVPAGSYTLTAVCDGTGKAFFAVTLDGKPVAEAGAACNGVEARKTRIRPQPRSS